MRANRWMVSVALALTASLFGAGAHAAGIQSLVVPAAGELPALAGAVWYPCASPPAEIRAGPFVLSATRDCEVTGRRLPLIVMSHGRGGTFLAHRDTAQALADAGFVVAAISHPGDNAQDSGAVNDLSVLLRRPGDMRRLVDHLLVAWPSASTIDADRIGIFGFSRGAYTALVAVGSVPLFGRDLQMCAGRTDPACDGLRRGNLPAPTFDGRIKAAVIADPLTQFFGPGSFEAVQVPIQLWRSERGGDGVTPRGVAALAGALPMPPELHTVAKAGHFAFLPPCPESLRNLAAELCSDEAGFDREAFHRTFNAEVVDFFRRSLLH